MLKKTWKMAMTQSPALKMALFAGGPSGVIWSVVWSVYDGFVNLWPMVFWLALIALILLMTWLTRNNP